MTESALRKRLGRRGYRLNKTPARWYWEYGDYIVTDCSNNGVFCSGTIEEIVEEFGFEL